MGRIGCWCWMAGTNSLGIYAQLYDNIPGFRFQNMRSILFFLFIVGYLPVLRGQQSQAGRQPQVDETLASLKAELFGKDTAQYNGKGIHDLRLSKTGTLRLWFDKSGKEKDSISLLTLRSYTTDSAGNHLLYGIKPMDKEVELFLDGPHEMMETDADGKITLKSFINVGTFRFTTAERALAFADALVALRKKISPYRGNPRNKWGQ